ncbi:unnamed protein product [Psylliodes chrysocephalus]|uniref:Uncharacterized protein n=1 Tax=Psylliodes chrysocephalus TaxID=3402493 RepID=A0A9P0D3C7_9CUCU|nr:unnamed protein product [Psylliodes chrysocephala]
MHFQRSLVVGLIVILQISCYELNKKRFPDHFRIGLATSAYQVEGGWNEDGKGENIWDRSVHSIPSPIFNKETGDIACDSYHKYKEDIRLLKNMGVDHYRFSISWSRILPTGYANQINEAGVNYYKNLIKEIRANGLEPLVTIYHWDLPQPLQDLGGWPNEYIVDLFEEYARVAFTLFGDDVKQWITINEPKQVCQEAYGSGIKAPFIKSHGLAEYLCTHNVIKAHAKAWHLYDDEFRNKQKGRVGIVIDTFWMEPASDSEADINAAERQLQFIFGWYANPILRGDYPWQMKKFIGERSAKQGFKTSRLPEFTKQEIDYINGTIDFLGVNYYTTNMVSEKNDTVRNEVSWEADAETIRFVKPEWPFSTTWLRVVPWGIGKVMHWVKKTYGDIPIWITENGMATYGESLEDDNRIEYYQKHLSYVRDALEDGINIIGYTAWSLMDNFEWQVGYDDRFGFYHVDFKSPNRTRTPRKSVGFYRQFATTRCIVDKSQCVDDNHMDNVLRYVYQSVAVNNGH